MARVVVRVRVRATPHLDPNPNQDIEIIFMTDSVDEYTVPHLTLTIEPGP